MIFFTSPLLTGRGGEVSTPGESVLRQEGPRQTLKLPHHFICSTSGATCQRSLPGWGGEDGSEAAPIYKRDADIGWKWWKR